MLVVYGGESIDSSDKHRADGTTQEGVVDYRVTDSMAVSGVALCFLLELRMDQALCGLQNNAYVRLIALPMSSESVLGTNVIRNVILPDITRHNKYFDMFCFKPTCVISGRRHFTIMTIRNQYAGHVVRCFNTSTYNNHYQHRYIYMYH